MLRRFIYGGLFAVVFIGLLIVVFLKKTDTITPASIFEAIPGDAVVIVEHLDFEYLTKDFFESNTIWNGLSSVSCFAGKDQIIESLIVQLAKNEEIEKFLQKDKLSLSFHLIGKDKLQPILFIDYSNQYTAREFINLFTTFLGEEIIINERRYEAELIYDVSSQLEFLPKNFSFTCLKGIFLFSPSSILVEESVRALHSDSGFLDDDVFLEVQNTAGRYVHANIYLNFAILNKLMFPFVDHGNWGNLEWLTKFANWSELDLDLKDDAVMLNGMTSVSDFPPFFLGSFNEQSPVKIELTDVLPSNTFYFFHLGINDIEKFYKGISEYLAETDEQVAFDEETDRIMNLYNLAPLKDLMEIMDDEAAWFLVESNSDQVDREIFVIETKSGSLARSKLKNWYNKYLEVNRYEPGSLVTEFRLDNQTRFEIYRLPDQFYEGQKAGKFFNRYYTIYDKYLLFGPTVDALSTVIYQNVLHKTLSSDPNFEDVSEFFSSRSNVSVFIKPYTYLSRQTQLLNDKTLSNISQSEPFLRKISGIVIQYSKEDGMFYNNISIKYTSHIKEKALTVWESLLDTVAIIKPSLVNNHNTSEKEIFIQDAGNKIYLINSTGRILWSLKIDGPVMSEVVQIDFYKNNKLQFLFNTKEKLHLIDRNGNYVERYPVNLRSHATNSMSLFDYDNSRDYRIFLAGEDKKTYLYDKEGNIVTDWKFRKTEGIVTKPLQYFRINEKDYIIISDPLRTYILDRRGGERIKLNKRVTVSNNNLLYLDMNIREGKPRWITTDTSGNIVSIRLNGEVETLVSRNATTDHFFRMQDMDRDGIPDFLITEENELVVLNSGGQKMFAFKTKGTITNQPDIYKFSASDIKIGITDVQNSRIYLLNSDGSLYEGFPLEGFTRFSIGYFAGSDSRFNLIVGSPNSFLYNYSIK